MANAVLDAQQRVGNADTARLLRARYPTGRTRTAKPPFNTAINDLDFHGGPTYAAAANRQAGGADSWAILGPKASWLNTNSDADANRPAAIRAARRGLPEASFKAGHLLNACFGGSGVDPKNLTILSAAGNSACRGFDEKIKLALVQLRNAYAAMWQDGIDVSPASVLLGIEVRAQVDETSSWNDAGPYAGTGHPFTCIFNRVRFTAGVRRDRQPADAEWESPGYKAAYDVAMTAVDAYVAAANAAGAIVNAHPGLRAPGSGGPIHRPRRGRGRRPAPY
jgi:hypothetical protein